MNSPIDNVTTLRLPATIPVRQFGSTTSKNRRQNPAPRLAAASSSAIVPLDAMIASTARTMNGRVNSTCPARMIQALCRNAPQPLYVMISANAVASPGTAIGRMMISSSTRATRPGIRASA